MKWMLVLGMWLLGVTAQAQSVWQIRVAVHDDGNAQHYSLTRQQLAQLPQQRYQVSTPWRRVSSVYEGPLLADALRLIGVHRFSRLELQGLDAYLVQLSLDDVEQGGPILAIRRNGREMSIREQGPVQVMFPFGERPELRQSHYYQRSVWQLESMEVSP